MPEKTKFKYLAKRKRYMRMDTKQLISKADMLRIQATETNEPGSKDEYGFTFNLNRSPESDIYSAIERLVGQGEAGIDVTKEPLLQQAGDKFNHLLAFIDRDDMTNAEPYSHRVRDPENRTNWIFAADKDQPPPHPIPTGIRSAMTLSEFYTNTQGDVGQTIEAPIDLSISELKISVPKDKGIEKKLRDLYGPEKLNMKHILYQIMLNTGVFGSAYPMEVPDDKDHPIEIVQVVPLPPKYMWVGYHVVSGTLVPETMASPYAMRPWDGSPNWSQELAKQMFMPMTYNAFASGFNEQNVTGWGLPVNPTYLHPVRAKAFDWNRYPLPPISKAFRSISTRAIYQEMRRGLLEGFKNQLWVFILGTKDAMPSPLEMQALKGAINGLSGSRTGNLVWRFGLDVQIKTPGVLQDSISSEVAQMFKMEIFSDLGMNIRLTTANKISMPGSGAGDAGVEIDLSVWLRRMEFIRKNIMEWEYLFRMRQADRWDAEEGGGGHKARLALENPKCVKFSRSLLEISEEIKSVVLPLYTVGLTSPQSSLDRADEDYETELQNKKDNEPNQTLFMPPPSFNQMTTGAGGDQKSSASTSSGRPPDAVNKNKMAAFDPVKLQAAANDSETKRLYFAAVIAALMDELWNNGDVETFIASLKSLNDNYLAKAADESYAAAGGVGRLDQGRRVFAANYVNSYIDGFKQDLNKMVAEEEPLSTNTVRRRTMMYPEEGYKSAVVNATNQVMAERGASHYRRVLHPELSKEGPCPACKADSAIAHSITEPFIVMHPHDVCGTQELGIQYFTSGGMPSIEVPTPNSGNELAQELFGSRKNGKVRRKRV